MVLQSLFDRGKMVRGEGLPVLEERMKIMDPDEIEIYKFLGIEQADCMKTRNVFERVKKKVKKRTNMLVETELNDTNLIRTINEKVIPVAEYPLNVCKFNKREEDSYSPVGFCISEIPVCKLLQQSEGYRMGAPGNRSISRTHSLLIEDMKQYQESHEIIKEVNQIIVQASLDNGASYGVAKCV